jgi:hypothetical protein
MTIFASMERRAMMRIDIRYDPATIHTEATINGIVSDKKDIYSFIFPVKDYPLQCWIYKNGSWKGITKYMKDIARGEDLEIVFHGRKLDFTDFKSVIDEDSWQQDVKVTFVEKTLEYEEAAKVLQKASAELELVHFYSAPKIDNITKCIQLKIQLEQMETYKREIHNLDRLFDTEPRSGCTYLVHEKALKSFEDIDKLVRLYQTMLIPADGILCLFRDPEKLQNFKAYADAMNCQVYCTDEINDFEQIYEKYSKPVAVYELYRLHLQIQKAFEKLQSETDIQDRIDELKQYVMDKATEMKRDELIHYKKWIVKQQDNIANYLRVMESARMLMDQ